jgi:hypothetical protein
MNLKNQQTKDTFFIVIPSVPIPPSYQFQGGMQTAAFVDLHYTSNSTISRVNSSRGANPDRK